MSQEQILLELRELRNEYASDARDISERLTRVETILVPFAGQPSILQNMGDRLTLLENFKYKLIGGIAIIGTFVESVIHYVLRKSGH